VQNSEIVERIERLELEIRHRKTSEKTANNGTTQVVIGLEFYLH
jgi:hypothetical protein